MSKVFIGGSISIKTLDDNVIARLDGIINKNFTVLIGDAFGADKEVQQYFASHKYKAVTVYACNNRARNNIFGLVISEQIHRFFSGARFGQVIIELVIVTFGYEELIAKCFLIVCRVYVRNRRSIWTCRPLQLLFRRSRRE